MGNLSDDSNGDPPDSGDGTTAHGGLRDYVFGPVLESIDNKTGKIKETLDEHLAKTSSINQNLATVASNFTDTPRGELAPRPREFTHGVEVEVPADTSVVDPITTRFESDYDATITQVDIEFPDGAQQAVGVQIRSSGGEKWIPRGGTRNIVGEEETELQYVQANDRTISTSPNIRVDEGNPIVVECISNDPSNNHIIEITMNLEERSVGGA